MKRFLTVGMLVSVVVFSSFAYIYYSSSLKLTRNIQIYMKNMMGKQYFSNNFKLVKSQYIKGSSTPPLISDDSYIYTYQFLPFSQKHRYDINISINLKTGEIHHDIPPCVLDEPPTRCDFKISYPQALNLAIQKFGEIGTAVTLVDKNGSYQWNATNTQGDPMCGARHKHFLINVNTGFETQIEESRSNFCI